MRKLKFNMVFKGVFVLMALFICMSCSYMTAISKKEREILISKPNSCYKVASTEYRGDTVKVFLELKEEGKVCAQVITQERLKVKGDPKYIEIYANGKLWKRGHLR